MNATNETLALIKAAQTQPSDDLLKSYSQSGTATSGLTFYDLEAPAKSLFPVLTPLRNAIARVTGGRGIQANWRAVTGINTTQVRAGVAEGQRGGAITHTTADYLAAFKFAGLEDYVTFEADWAAQGFDDVKALAVQNLLRSVMIQEEFMDLGGNASVALGTCGTPTLVDVPDGGALTHNKTYNVRCVALTLSGYQQVAGVANGTVNDAAAIASVQIKRTFSRTNMDATSDTVAGGCSQVSAQAQVSTANDSKGHGIKASVTPKTGAVAYAWFWGENGSDVLLGAVTTINSVLITATATGTQNVTDFTTSAADNSTDSLVYDGLLTQIMKSGSGAYFVDLATGTPGTGTALTSDGAGGVTQIEAALASFWDNYRLSPSKIYVNAAQLQDISKLVVANGGAPLIRFAGEQGGGSLAAGVVVNSYLNKITGQSLKIEVHPNMPVGTMMFWSDSVPYPVSNTGTLVRKLLRRDYYQIEWPLRTRRYEYGVYFDGVLQNFFPPAFGIVRNIARS